MKRVTPALAVVVLLFCGFGLLWAAPPSVPDQINYQGVLRDASDQPLEGLYDMVFRLFDADSGGNEILVDGHEASGTGAVGVSRGLFNVPLGGGAVSDGVDPGPGDPYTSLAQVFRDYGEVWLEVEVNGETLSPRTRISSAAYALNSSHLGGFSSSDFGRLAAGNTWSGQNTLHHLPAGAGIADGGLYLNPASAAADATLLGASVGGSPKLRLDADGDLSVNRYLVAQSLYGKGLSPWVALEDAAGANLLASLQAWDAGDAMWIDDYQNGRTVLYSNTSGVGVGSAATDPSYAVTTPSLKVLNDQIVGGDLEVDGFVLNLDGGFLRLRNTAGTILTQMSANDTQNHSYLYDFQNSRYMFYSNPNGIGIGTTTPINGYTATMPSLYLSGGSVYGVLGEGATAGGAFQDGNQSGFGRVGYADYGGWFQGDATGSYNVDSDSSANALVGSSTYKILGSGAVSFMQNHPADADRVIVYAAPEGDEVATYTRGSARLLGGVARVALGETFKWVTNPEIGLTATVTPRGSWSDLYVESVTPSELLVKSAGGASDAAFDYVVFGLRIGFEESSIVQEKVREAYIPSMADHRGRYERSPELRRFNALERFRSMGPDVTVEAAVAGRQGTGGSGSAQALREAIGEFDPLLDVLPLPPGAEVADAPIDRKGGGTPADPAVAHPAVGPAAAAPEVPGPTPAGQPEPAADRSGSFAAGLVEIHLASEPIEAGDVLVADPRAAGRLARGRSDADPAVVGIAAADSPPAAAAEASRQVRVSLAGTTLCKVDASYGSVQAGDLLTTSPTPGHARVAAAATPGTILGKALESLDAGTGTIRVLVMPR